MLAKIEKLLKELKMTKNDIAECVLVGGSSKIPKVREMVENYFGKKPNIQIDADKSIAYGAAIECWNLQ